VAADQSGVPVPVIMLHLAELPNRFGGDRALANQVPDVLRAGDQGAVDRCRLQIHGDTILPQVFRMYLGLFSSDLRINPSSKLSLGGSEFQIGSLAAS